MRRTLYLATTALFSTAALAQPPQSVAAPDSNRSRVELTEEERDSRTIVVTGSRIPRTDLDTPSSVMVLSPEIFQVNAETNVVRALNEMPQFQPDRGPLNTNVFPGSYLSLRGLGALRTLTLVNGRRFINTLSDRGVDVSTIPPELIGRVEVLTGGASATYGSDAIAGVVNFILKDDWDGFEINTQAGVTDRGEGLGYRVALTGGSPFAGGRGSFWIHGSWDKSKTVRAGNRDFINPQVSNATPANGTFVPVLTTSTPSGTVANAGQRVQFDANGELFNAAGQPNILPPDQFYNRAPFLVLQQAQERVEFAAGFKYDLTDSLQLYSEAFYVHDKADRPQFPNPATAALLNVEFGVNNPFLGPRTQAYLTTLDTDRNGLARFSGLARQFDELGERNTFVERNSYRLLGGVKFDISDNWKLDASANYSYSSYHQRYVGEIDKARLAQALDAVPGPNGSVVCRNPSGGCVPINIFGPGKISPAAAAFVGGDLHFQGLMKDTVLLGTITGNLFDLPAGPVGFSGGVEYQHRNSSETPDRNILLGLTTFTQFGKFAGTSSSTETFGEVSVPIFRDAPFFNYLGLEAGVRYTKLGTGPHAWTYKALAEWAPIPELKFRGGIQHAVRHPVVFELVGTEFIANQPLGTDPCFSGSAPASPLTGTLRDRCLATGFPATLANSGAVGRNFLYTSFFNGSGDLGPETADTLTLGVVLRNPGIPNFSVTADYYNIKVTNIIQQFGGDTIINFCYFATDPRQSDTLCNRIERDPVSGAITRVRNSYGNNGVLRTSGIDFGVNYLTEVPSLTGGDANVSLRANGTYAIKWNSTPFEFQPTVRFSCVGLYGSFCSNPGPTMPRWKTNTTLAWNDGPVTLSVNWEWLSSMKDFAKKYPPANNPTLFANLAAKGIPSYHYFNIAGVFRVGKAFEFRAGVDNVFDKDGPIVGSDRMNFGRLFSRYDPIGRRYFFGALARF